MSIYLQSSPYALPAHLLLNVLEYAGDRECGPLVEPASLLDSMESVRSPNCTEVAVRFSYEKILKLMERFLKFGQEWNLLNEVHVGIADLARTPMLCCRRTVVNMREDRVHRFALTNAQSIYPTGTEVVRLHLHEDITAKAGAKEFQQHVCIQKLDTLFKAVVPFGASSEIIRLTSCHLERCVVPPVEEPAPLANVAMGLIFEYMLPTTKEMLAVTRDETDDRFSAIKIDFRYPEIATCLASIYEASRYYAIQGEGDRVLGVFAKTIFHLAEGTGVKPLNAHRKEAVRSEVGRYRAFHWDMALCQEIPKVYSGIVCNDSSIIRIYNILLMCKILPTNKAEKAAPRIVEVAPNEDSTTVKIVFSKEEDA